MSRRLRRLALGGALVVLLGVSLIYAALWLTIWRDAQTRLAQTPQPADAALILGNRAYRQGEPNPCLTGRVDAGVALVRAGLARQLLMSGGFDKEDGRNESEVMEAHARSIGYDGPLLRESASQSTRENLMLSQPLLQAAGVRRVIVVSEPYHLWRAERLARATGFASAFDSVQYAAAPTRCWTQWGMGFRGALREPLAIINNALHGL
ncbi:MAG: YdcF family protein [Pseudomonadota bacterium]